MFSGIAEAGSTGKQTGSLLPAPVKTGVTLVTRINGGGTSGSAFPTALLPADIAEMVEALATMFRVPEALPGSCALAITSAAIGRGLTIRSASHRTTSANLYVVVAARSGAGKSECFGPLIKPVFAFQQRIIDDWKTRTRPRMVAAKLIAETRIGKLRTLAATSEEPDELNALAQELTKMISLKASIEANLSTPLLVCEDVTSERLAILLGQNSETLLSASSDAGAVLNNLLGRYSRVGRTDENLYLKGYSGDACRVDRVGRQPVVLTRPCLALLWLVQPDKLDTMFSERSLSDGGLLPRVMVCQANTEPFKIDRALGIISPDVTQHWHQLVFDLLQAYHQRRDAPCVLVPTREAVVMLDEHQHDVVERRRGELADADAFAARWNEWAWRLAVVIHAAKHRADAHNHQVQADTTSAAIRLANWFSDQQLEYLEMSRAAAKSKKADHILDLLRLRSRKRWPKNAVNARDVQRARIALTPVEATALLNQMEQEGKLASKDYRPNGGGYVVRYYAKPSRRA